MGRGRWTLLIVAVAGSLWYLQAPPRTADGYAGRAADTAASLRAQVETARIWVETVAEGRTLLTSAAVGLEEADGDAATVLADFEQLDPPAGTAAVRESVSATGREAVNLLGGVRIAAQDGDWERVERRRDRLARMGDRLHALEREARP